MAHQYKVGDKVRIKSREGLSENYPFIFTSEMTILAGKTFTINEIRPNWINETSIHRMRRFYNGDDNLYILSNDSHGWHSSMFEPVEESLLKEGDSITIGNYTGTLQITLSSHQYYILFKGKHQAICTQLKKSIPNFNNIALEHHGIQNVCFPTFPELSDLENFIKEINNIYKSQNYEIRFQKQKATIRGGSIPTGHSVCGRRCKTAVTIGHLSNQKISC